MEHTIRPIRLPLTMAPFRHCLLVNTLASREQILRMDCYEVFGSLMELCFIY